MRTTIKASSPNPMVHHDQNFLKNNESESLAEKIISDHMKFVCADGALEMWNERCRVSNEPFQKTPKGPLSTCTRKEIMSLVENGSTFEAFKMCSDLDLFDMEVEEEMKTKETLSKLVFVDLLRRGKHMEAVDFARDFINEENEGDKLFTLIGYEDASDPKFSEIIRFIKRDKIIDALNRHLFKKEVGRELSLLSLALNHYASILKYQKK